MYRRRIKTEENAKVVAAVLPNYSIAIFHQADLKKRMNPVHTIPNHHPTKMDVLLKTFVQIIPAANG